MTNKDTYDVAIIGGGLSGLSLTCLLGQSGVSVACIDQAPAALPANTDLRTTAISYGSRQILERAGVWKNLPAAPCPIKDIQILDGTSPLLLNFMSAEVEDKSFGWIVLNADLRAALMKTLEALPSVAHMPATTVQNYEVLTSNGDTAAASPSSPGLHYVKCILEGKAEKGGAKQQEINAKLVVGADGRNSFTRQWMADHTGLRTRQWSYKQRAVICTVQHQNPHENIAVEHFWPQGPFAILPMADGPKGEHRSSVVFTEHGPDTGSLMHFDDATFETALAARFPARYGDVKLLGKRACYPLGLVHATTYIASRMALIADAAHGIHPIAGQGLNLGFRDVAELARLVGEAHAKGEDVGAPKLLETYQRRRRPDNMAMVAMTDGLNRLFSNNIMPVRVLRKMGLRAVSKIPLAKRFFMRQAMGDR